MPSKSQRILRYLLILLVVVLVGAVGYRVYQIQQEKRDFAKAEQSIDSLAQQIEQLIGKPDETRKEKSCDRANMKNARGPLGCDITLMLLYKDRNLDNANSLLSQLTTLSSSELRIGGGGTRGKSFVSPELQRGIQRFFQKLPDVSSLSCGLGYSYPANFESNLSTNQGNDMIVSVSCSAFPIKQQYPLKD